MWTWIAGKNYPHATYSFIRSRTGKRGNSTALSDLLYADTFFTGLQLGIDNLRHDVHLSPKFVEQTRLHVARLITRHGTVEGLLAAEAPAPGRPVGNISRCKTHPQKSYEVTAFRPQAFIG